MSRKNWDVIPRFGHDVPRFGHYMPRVPDGIFKTQKLTGLVQVVQTMLSLYVKLIFSIIKKM